MSISDEVLQLRAALAWALAHGVQVTGFGLTGYMAGDSDIMPPAGIHVVLDRARNTILENKDEQQK